MLSRGFQKRKAEGRNTTEGGQAVLTTHARGPATKATLLLLGKVEFVDKFQQGTVKMVAGHGREKGPVGRHTAWKP